MASYKTTSIADYLKSVKKPKTSSGNLPFISPELSKATNVPKTTITGTQLPRQTTVQEAVSAGLMKPVQQPATSYIQSGQDYIKSRQDRGLPSDASTVKKLYRDWGLEQRLGTWVGSAEQYRAMSQYENQQWESIQTGLAQTTAQAQELGEQVAKEGVTSKTGETLIPPTTPLETPETKNGLGAGQNITDTPEVQIDPDQIQDVVNNTIDQIGSTDLADIMTEVSAEGWSPEMTIAGEENQASLDALKTSTATALQTMQQNLATRGLTFSGIRTQKEEGLAADAIAKEAGINRDFALKIVQAARSEQTRREKAIQAAETNYSDALEKLGYAYNPFTDKIEKSLEAKQYELDVYKATTDTYKPPTSFQEWELAGGEEETGMSYGTWVQQNSTNPILDSLRLLQYQTQQAQTTPVPGQLVYKSNPNIAANNLPAVFTTKINVLKFIKDESEGIIPSMMILLKDPEVDVSGIFGAIKEFGYQNWGRFIPGLNRVATDKEKELMNYMTMLSNEYVYAKSGAQINEQELARLKKSMPDVGLTAEDNIRRLSDFTNVVNSIINSSLDSYGVMFAPSTPTPTYTSGFQAPDDMGLLEDDITYYMEKPEYQRQWGREQMIKDLGVHYSGLTENEISDIVYRMTNQKNWNY